MTNQKPLPMYLTYGVRNEAGELTSKIEVPYNQRKPIVRNFYLGPYAGKAGTDRLATASTRYSNIITNTNVTNGLEEIDRDWFRPESTIPTQPNQIMVACRQAYDRFSIVRNIIDMMADFTVKGVKVVNKNKTAEKFGKEWFTRVKGKDRTERIAHMLYMMGTVPIKRNLGKLPADMKKPVLKKPIRLKRQNPIKPGHIPLEYIIQDPVLLELPDNPPNTPYGGITSYAIRPPALPLQRTNELKMQGPSWLNQRNEDDTQSEPLDPSKDVLLFYKKSDHEIVPQPLMYPILRDLRTLGKLKMSDDAALDGACSRTRLWRLGYINPANLADSIFPSEEALAQLADVLTQNVGGGTMDMVWDPLLDFKETGSDLDKFLGKLKYGPTLDSIYHGFGVPASMSGGAAEGGHTATFVTISIMAERLEYGRNILKDFWEAELEIIQSQMGYRDPFYLIFDDPVFTDESAEKRLLIELLDRGIISDEVVRDRFGCTPEIEESRLKKELAKRKRGDLQPKAGPFSLDYQRDIMNERAFVGQGVVSPDQVGLHYENPKDGAKTPIQIKTDETIKVQKASPKNKAGGVKDPSVYNAPGKKGRPAGKDDVVKRKRKRVVPLGKGSLEEDETSLSSYLVAVASVEKAQVTINSHIKEAYLEMVGKNSTRQLSSAEADELENICFGVLCNISFDEAPTYELVVSTLSKSEAIPEEILNEYSSAITELGKDAPIETLRSIKAGLVASYRMV